MGLLAGRAPRVTLMLGFSFLLALGVAPLTLFLLDYGWRGLVLATSIALVTVMAFWADRRFGRALGIVVTICIIMAMILLLARVLR